jgi:hypothetical protein
MHEGRPEGLRSSPVGGFTEIPEPKVGSEGRDQEAVEEDKPDKTKGNENTQFSGDT